MLYHDIILNAIVRRGASGKGSVCVPKRPGRHPSRLLASLLRNTNAQSITFCLSPVDMPMASTFLSPAFTFLPDASSQLMTALCFQLMGQQLSSSLTCLSLSVCPVCGETLLSLYLRVSPHCGRLLPPPLGPQPGSITPFSSLDEEASGLGSLTPWGPTQQPQI